MNRNGAVLGRMEGIDQPVENSSGIFWVWDIRKGKLEFSSPEFNHYFQNSISFSRNPSRALLGLVPRPDRHRVRRMMVRQAQGKQTNDIFRILRSNGTQVRINVRSFPWWGKDGRLQKFWGMAKELGQENDPPPDDLADCREKLRHLASMASQSGFRERKKLAAVLHDQVAPMLFLANLKATQLKSRLDEADNLKLLSDIQQDLDRAMGSIRGLFVQMNSPVLAFLGLPRALEGLAKEFQAAHGLRITVRDNGRVSGLSDDLQEIVYWSIRELMINTIKHARASVLDISLNRIGPTLKVSVHDDGVGFEPGDPLQWLLNGQGFGLFSIRERFETLGGRVEVVSRPGSGTRINLSLNLSGDQVQSGSAL